MTTTRHGTDRASQDWERRGTLRRMLLEHYDRDADFRRDLRTLTMPTSDDGWDQIKSVRTMNDPTRSREDRDKARKTLEVPDLDSDWGRIANVAYCYGLGRLTADEHSGDGIALLLQWAQLSQQSSRDYSLSAAFAFGGLATEIAVEDRIAWDPASKSRRAALIQLTAQVDALLARGEAEANAHGYSLTDTAPKVREHVEWTYRRVRGWTYPRIAEVAKGYRPNARGVRQEVERMAVEIGLRLDKVTHLERR